MTRCRMAILAAMLAVNAATAALAQDSNEFWPEAQFHYWFDDRTRAIAMAAVSRDMGSHTSYQAEEGLTLEHRFADFLLGRIGYRHGGATDGEPFNENRLLTEQTLRLHLPSLVIVDFRNRQDFRWLDSGFSIRFRERIQVQRDVTVDSYTFTPYASAEVFFDTRYGQFSRYRLPAGVTLPIVRHFSLEPYLVRQVDYVGNSAIINAVGLIFIAAF